MRAWYLLGALGVLIALCGAQVLPSFAGIAALLQPFIPTKLAYGGNLSGTLAAVGLGLFEAGVLAGYITNYSQVTRRAYDQERKKKKEALEEIKKEQEAKTKQAESKKSPIVYEADYEDADAQIPSRPSYGSPSSQNVYHSPTSTNIYHSSSPQNVYRSPSPQNVYRSPSPQYVYRSPSSQYVYPNQFTRRQTRSNKQELQQVDEVQRLLMSAATQLDTDGCVLKLLCHLDTKEQEERTLQEDVLLNLFYNSPEMLSSYNTELRARGTGLDETRGTGLNQTRGTGLDETRGTGLNQARGTGLNQTRGTGLDETRGTGLNQARGTGLNQARGTGLNQTRGTGLNHARGTGLNQARGTGLNQTRGTGLNHARGTGLNQARGTGLNQAKCDQVFSKCPVRAVELASLMGQLWGCDHSSSR
nr:uncharacterized protein LOC123772952 [Procambarus clarkii]